MGPPGGGDPGDDVEHHVVRLDVGERARIREVINAAASAYEGVIPASCYTEPYMGASELAEALEAMAFFGVEHDGRLLGVMGVQAVEDVRLIRHLYVRPTVQRQGIGTRLIEVGIDRAGEHPLLVGTWEAAEWAIRFYENNGFENLGTDRDLLDRYWNVSPAHAAASVVLRYTGERSRG